MGCDIHAHVEVREDGQWHHWEEMFAAPFHVGRNYDLFAILANVRNGYGFAGVPTSGGFTPIDMPRGLPEDVTPEVKQESDDWGVDGHSHSWLTLAELLACDYDGQTVHQYGVVGPDQYQRWKDYGKPESWSAGVLGSMVKNVDHFTMDQVIAHQGRLLDDPEGTAYYTRVEWDETYRDAVGERWFATLDALKELGEPENVRLVFWFDN